MTGSQTHRSEEHYSEWRLHAKCRRPQYRDDPKWIDPRLIKIPSGADPEAWRNTVAAGMCSGCPVLDDCKLEAIEMADQDQVKAGYALWDTDWKVRKQHNEMRADLGMPVEITRMDELADKYPAPCGNGCGRLIRVYPMRKSDFPDTTLGSVMSGNCYVCDEKLKEEKEIGNSEQESR